MTMNPLFASSSGRAAIRAGAPLLLLALAAGCGDTTSSGPGGKIQVTVSGEALALGGYAFPPALADDPPFVDGWEVRFDEVIAVIDKVMIHENPDSSPSDQSQVGPMVAHLDGPWAVDLHKGGPLTGKGGTDEQAVALGMIESQNDNGGKPFDETLRYGFGFDLIAARDNATKVNLDAQGSADYAEMVKNGWAVLYVGTATWKGTNCTSTNAMYDFKALPTTVKFRFGFKTPTTYVNCQNPDNDPAEPLGSDEHQRGVQVKGNSTTVAQVTVHTDHPFWESVEHEAAPHFDALAARAKKVGADFVVTLDDVKGVNYTAITDAAGAMVPWRSCLAGYTPPNMSASMGYDAKGVPYTPAGDPAAGLRDLADYMAYNQSTQGHLNADGLCFVKRNYPSPK